MNENQKAFLDELAALFDKYYIDEMSANGGDVSIDFMSNNETLRVECYSNDNFYNVRAIREEYKPKREGAENDG